MMFSKLFLAAAGAAVATASVVPTVKISPTVYMPLAGLGTWLYNSSVAEQAVSDALALGYTHIDTALVYANQDGVGRAIAKSGRARDTLFVTSKVPGGTNVSAATANLNLALQQLGLDYVDLMLIHYPADWNGVGGKIARQQTWQALEAFHKAGKAKAIGVSHYCKQHVLDVLEINTVPIAVNQVQYHVGMGSEGPLADDDKKWMQSQGILYQSFSPLCGPCPDPMELITGKLVTGIGAKYGKTGAQVALKWLVQQGIPVIPKSQSPKHMIENIDLFDWNLSADDMHTLTASASPAVAGGTPAGTSGDCSIA